MKKEITWEDNPRIDIENRIKQLEGRWEKIYWAKNIWISRWPLWESKNRKIRKLIQQEINLRRSQLRDFDKCPNLKFD